jgi:hypothetical protein
MLSTTASGKERAPDKVRGNLKTEKIREMSRLIIEHNSALFKMTELGDTL